MKGLVIYAILFSLCFSCNKYTVSGLSGDVGGDAGGDAGGDGGGAGDPEFTVSISAFGDATTLASVGISCGLNSCSASGSWASAQAGCEVTCSEADAVTLTANVNGETLRYISRYQTGLVDSETYNRLNDTQSISESMGILSANTSYTVEFLTQTKHAMSIQKSSDAFLNGPIRLTCLSSLNTCEFTLDGTPGIGNCSVECVDGEDVLAEIDVLPTFGDQECEQITLTPGGNDVINWNFINGNWVV